MGGKTICKEMKSEYTVKKFYSSEKLTDKVFSSIMEARAFILKYHADTKESIEIRGEKTQDGMRYISTTLYCNGKFCRTKSLLIHE